VTERCECGCGQPAPVTGARYVRGHNRVHQGREVSDQRCACGCGGRTLISKQTVRARGWVKGQPLRWINGHAGRGEDGFRPPVDDEPDPVPLRRRPPRGVGQYAEQLAHASALVVGAVHDEGPDAVLAAIAEALRIPAPPEVDPVVALVTVLAAQVPTDRSLGDLLAWTTQPGPRSPQAHTTPGAA